MKLNKLQKLNKLNKLNKLTGAVGLGKRNLKRRCEERSDEAISLGKMKKKRSVISNFRVHGVYRVIEFIE